MRHEIKSTYPLLRLVLSNEAFYCDGPPHWDDEQSSAQASKERLRTARFLKKHFGDQHYLTEKLRNCGAFDRCLSGACTECTRAAQRWFVGEASNIYASCGPRTYFCSLVIGTCPEGSLATSPLVRIERTLKNALHRVGLTFALGGYDFSFNTGGDDPNHWAFQLWFLTDQKDWKHSLVQTCSNEKIDTPIKFYEFDGNPAAFAYAIKNNFDRRDSYRQEKRNRACKNTRHLPLRVREKKELLAFLDREGLESRLFLVGVRPTKTKDGVKLVRLKSGQNSENDENDS